jgi:multiple sugar transport system permease protein
VTVQSSGSDTPQLANTGQKAATRTFGYSVQRTLRRPQFWFGFTLLVPTLLWYWFFSYRPIINAFRLAVVRYQILDPAASPFVGLDNFRRLFEHPLFFISVRNTLTWAVLSFLLMIPISMGISVCLANIRRGRNLYQGLIFLPVVVSIVAVLLMFRMLMDPEIGQFNQILRAIGLPGFDWLSNSTTALPTSVGIGVWKGMGFYIVILTAGLLGIPKELYDAALVDGANEWQRFWRITLPLLGHTLVLVTVLLAIGSLQEFTLPFILTNGGPGNATYLYNLHIYGEAFTDLRFGTATAAALLQFFFILIISALQLRFLRPTWSY